MKLWHRVWASVTRQKGKSLILFLVVFILGNVMAGAIAIDQSVNQSESLIKAKLGTQASFELDYPSFRKAVANNPNIFEELEDVPLETIHKIGESQYVSYYDYSIGMYIESNKWAIYDPAKPELVDDDTEILSSLYLKGVHLGELLDVKEKRIELVEGRTLTEEEIDKGTNVTVVSKDWAKINNIQIGDTIVLDNLHYEHSQDGIRSPKPSFIQELPVKVVGLFSPIIVEQKESTKKTDLDHSRDYQKFREFNTLYVPDKIASDLTLAYFQEWAKIRPDDFTEDDIKRESEIYTPIYVLKSPEMEQDFKQDSQSLLPKYYQMLTSSDQYNAIAGSLNNMKTMANNVLIISSLVSIFILTLIILLFLRDRRYELGIYMSLGESRRKVISQIICEVMLITVFAISLSVITGNLLVTAFSESLIEFNTPEVVNSMESLIPEFVGNSAISESDANSSYKVSLTAGYVGMLYLFGLLTSIIATLFPTLYLLRLNPKKILML